jgi:hypothetical protein
VTRVEVVLCSTEEEATDEVSVQPVGLAQGEDWCPETKEEDWETDEEGVWVHVSFQLLADARPTRPARMEKDFILLQMFKSISINYCF